MTNRTLVAVFFVVACRSPSVDVVRVDGAMPIACGSQTCGPQQVCVHPQCADCADPSDGGACPDGFTRDFCPTAGGSCVGPYHDVYELHCEDLPAGCDVAHACNCLPGCAACMPAGDRAVACLCY